MFDGSAKPEMLIASTLPVPGASDRTCGVTAFHAAPSNLNRPKFDPATSCQCVPSAIGPDGSSVVASSSSRFTSARITYAFDETPRY